MRLRCHICVYRSHMDKVVCHDQHKCVFGNGLVGWLFSRLVPFTATASLALSISGSVMAYAPSFGAFETIAPAFDQSLISDLIYFSVYSKGREFHETCHSVTFHFMKKDSKRCCDTTTPESIHTKDESKRGSVFAFIFGVN